MTDVMPARPGSTHRTRMLQPTASQWRLDLASSSLVFGVRHLLTTVQGRFTRFNVDLSLDPARPRSRA